MSLRGGVIFTALVAVVRKNQQLGAIGDSGISDALSGSQEGAKWYVCKVCQVPVFINVVSCLFINYMFCCIDFVILYLYCHAEDGTQLSRNDDAITLNGFILVVDD